MGDEPASRDRVDGGSLTALPTLLKLQHGYRVYDPRVLTGGRVLQANGTIESGRDVLFGLMAIGAMGASAAVPPILFSDGSVLLALAWAAGGLGAGFMVFGTVIANLDVNARYRKRHGASPYVDVSQPAQQGAAAGRKPAKRRTRTQLDTRAIRLCELADFIAESESWQQGVIDPERRLAATTWSAATRAVRLSELHSQLHKDGNRPTSPTVLDERLREMDQLAAELDRVEENLSEIARISRRLKSEIAPGDPVRDRRTRATTNTDDNRDHSNGIREHARAVHELLRHPGTS